MTFEQCKKLCKYYKRKDPSNYGLNSDACLSLRRSVVARNMNKVQNIDSGSIYDINSIHVSPVVEGISGETIDNINLLGILKGCSVIILYYKIKKIKK